MSLHRWICDWNMILVDPSWSRDSFVLDLCICLCPVAYSRWRLPFRKTHFRKNPFPKTPTESLLTWKLLPKNSYNKLTPKLKNTYCSYFFDIWWSDGIRGTSDICQMPFKIKKRWKWYLFFIKLIATLITIEFFNFLLNSLYMYFQIKSFCKIFATLITIDFFLFFHKL